MMPVHVTNETRKRLHRESWSRRFREALEEHVDVHDMPYEEPIDTAESVQADAELNLSPGNVNISPDVLQPQGCEHDGLEAGLIGCSVEVEKYKLGTSRGGR